MIRADASWEWLPMVKLIEAEQAQREAGLVADVGERIEMWAAAMGEVVRLAATPPQEFEDGTEGDDRLVRDLRADIARMRAALEEAEA